MKKYGRIIVIEIDLDCMLSMITAVMVVTQRVR